MAPNDAQLVRQTLAGDTDAFGQLVERYSGLVHGSILSVVRRPDEVEDLVQEAFCKAYQKLDELRQKTRFAPWVAQIAQRAALHHVRHREVRRRAESKMGTEPSDTQEPVVALFRPPAPDEAYEAGEREELLRQALDRLEPAQRRLIVLYHVEGCTLQEMARFLQAPVATVRWRLRKAEAKLGRHLGEALGEGLRLGAPGRRRAARKVVAAIGPLALYPADSARAIAHHDHGTAPVLLSVAASVLVHFAGFNIIGDTASDDSAAAPIHRRGPTGLSAQLYEAEAPRRIAIPPLERLLVPVAPPAPPAAAPPEAPVAAAAPTAEAAPAPDPTEPPPAAPAPAPTAEAAPTPDPTGPEGAAPSDDLDLLQMEDIARVSNDRAVAYADPDDRQGLMGLLHLRPLSMAGAAAPYSALRQFSDFLRAHTKIRAKLRRHAYYFRGSELLEEPIHFLLQTHPAPAFGRRHASFTHFDPNEVAMLGTYLRRDGLLYAEGNQWYLAEIYHYIHHALEGAIRIYPLPGDHPLYTAYYDFSGGLPGERKDRPQDADWYKYPDSRNQQPTHDPLGLWGIEHEGKLAVVLSDLVLLGRRPPPADGPDWATIRDQQLAAMTNVLAYALTRPDGLTVQKARPVWTRFGQRR